MDPDKVQVYCGQHFYFGPSKAENPVPPAKSCPRCMFVLYFHDIANTPPEKRGERMDELEKVIHDVVQEVEAGRWDFEPYRHSKFDLELESK